MTMGYLKDICSLVWATAFIFSWYSYIIKYGHLSTYFCIFHCFILFFLGGWTFLIAKFF